MIVDKSCILQVLGGLMKHPQYLSEIDKYNFSLADFPMRLDKYIFAAIQNLYSGGAKKITAFDIQSSLELDQTAKKTFELQNGLEYLQDMEDLVSEENLPYYYDKLKKINLLNDLARQGISINEFYCQDLTNDKAQEINQRFDELSPQDIVDAIKKKLVKLESEYAKTESVQSESITDGLDEIIDNIENSDPDIGLPVQGRIYNQIIDGAQLGTLTIRSGSSGLGKTRQAVGDACLLAFPMRYNWALYKWELIGNAEKVLFVITEQDFDQIKRMVLAYLSGVNEEKIKYHDLSKQELEVLRQAAEVMKHFSSNFIMLRIPDPSIELIKANIREKCLVEDVRYVFYDYIFISTGLLKEFKGFNLRNDELLLLMATALKDLSVELQVCMMTSTQVNASADDSKEIRNEASLAGGRATINKADNGAIMARPQKQELDILKEVTKDYGVPNLVTDIFKVRSGKWTQVRIWSIVDLGVMRKEDLFVTDASLEPVENFYSYNNYFEVKSWEEEKEKEITDFYQYLNANLKCDMNSNIVQFPKGVKI